MHESVLRFVAENLYENEVRGKSVLEVGSANVNGSVRPLVERFGPSEYIGIDLSPGPGVDVVCPISSYFTRASLVISTEMLEHAEDWQRDLEIMCTCASETLIITARGPGFPRHNPPDHWRFRCDDLSRAVEYFGLRVIHISQDPQVPGVFLKAVRPSLIDVMRAPEV